MRIVPICCTAQHVGVPPKMKPNIPAFFLSELRGGAAGRILPTLYHTVGWEFRSVVRRYAETTSAALLSDIAVPLISQDIFLRANTLARWSGVLYIIAPPQNNASIRYKHTRLHDRLNPPTLILITLV